MRKTVQALLAAAAMATMASSAAHADIVPLIDGGGWNVFYFGSPNFGPEWQTLAGDDLTFTFDLAKQTYLRVADGYNDGDQFTVTINGVDSDTSVPVFTGNNIFDNWSSVFTHPDIGATYSHATYLLGPGSYTVTGFAIQSPFGSGAAAIELGAFGSGAPEPTTWAMMLAGFGGLGAMLRSRRKAAVATAA